VILADTSVWIDHLRRGNSTLRAHLAKGRIVCHPFIVGELALGTLRNRTEVLTHLQRLPQLSVASHDEVLGFIERRRLFALGIGWVDAHLLAAALLAGARLWAFDATLARVARRVRVGALSS
jgi:predicted nucleic acid-binding protein